MQLLFKKYDFEQIYYSNIAITNYHEGNAHIIFAAHRQL